MAQVDGSTSSIFRPVRAPSGSPAIRYFQESTAIATAVIRRGDVVSFNTVVTTGARIVRAPSSGGTGTNLLQVGVTSLLGVALQDSTSDGSTTGLLASTAAGNRGIRQIAVAIADGLTEFAGTISSVGATPLNVTSSLVGNLYAIQHNRTLGRWFIDSTNTTVALFACVVTDVPTESLGDTGGIVYFKFLSSNVSPAVRIGGPLQ